MGQIGCPETSVSNYHHTLRNITEERRSQQNKQFTFTYTGKHIGAVTKIFQNRTDNRPNTSGVKPVLQPKSPDACTN